MSKPEKSLRQELLDARAKLQRQIEIIQAGPTYNIKDGQWPRAPEQIAELTATLKEIEDSLAELGDDDS